jgi:DnaK suppressor protein
MTHLELTSFRKQLLALKKRLGADVYELGNEAFQRKAEGGISRMPSHLADLGTDNAEQQMTITLLECEGRTLAETAEALARLDAGTFGRCEACEDEISTERLEALPYVRHCVECARQSEQEVGANGGW